MNIIIPASGLGTRFKDTHNIPKPLIVINGKPMIAHAIESLGIGGRYFFTIRNDINWLKITSAINTVIDNSEVILIDKVTEGPACSALLFKDKLDLEDELIIANCDQIMNWNSKKALEILRRYDAGLVVYTSTDTKNSFALIQGESVVSVKEKIAISNVALTGIHYWKKAKYFVQSAMSMIEANDRTNNEFYVGPTYNYLNNKIIGVYHVSENEYYPVGTPDDLKRYLDENTKIK